METLTKAKNSDIKNLNNEEYDMFMLWEDLRQYLQKIVDKSLLYNGRLPYTTLSKLLGQVRSHIKQMKANVKARNISSHTLALDYLNSYSENLKLRFGEKIRPIFKFIEKYKDFNSLRKSSLYQVYKYHPHLKIDYFEKIDSKEKAYWLGFL